MIVVDANVLAYLLIDGPKSRQARALLERDPEWAVPPLWRHEFLNILAASVRTGRLGLAQAEGLLGHAVRLLEDNERQPDMAAALRLAARHKLSAYDAQYVALAQHLGVLCVSEDAKLRAAAPKGLVTSLAEQVPGASQ